MQLLNIAGKELKFKDSSCVPNPLFALEMPLFIGENYPEILRNYWGENTIKNPLDFFKKVQISAKDIKADFISLYFNFEEPEDSIFKEEIITNAKETLSKIIEISDFPLIIKGTGQKNWDEKLICALIPLLKEPSIIAPIQDTNYKNIIKCLINCNPKNEHFLVLRTPIDINLTKELNILSCDEGLSKKKILIDPDMGCIGYGIDYGYSIIERIGLAREQSDDMLDMPIIVFAGEETYKAKEAKSNDFAQSWGELKKRSLCWEIATASSLICAGANIVVLWHPETIKILKEEFNIKGALQCQA